jgi:3-hydroxybutyrate dehydrogenase
MMLKGLSAVVTGSTSGIGAAIAERFAKEGAHVMLNGFGDKQAIEGQRAELEKKYGVDVRYHGADMTKPDEISDLIQQAKEDFGHLDILVNNAGIQHVAPIEDFPVQKWDAVLAINLSSAFHTIQAAMPLMKEQDFGRIINVASAHGLVASPCKSAYVAAKHGIVGLTKVVALEAAECNITCNAVCPGWVDTPLVREQIKKRADENGTSVEEEEKALIGEKQPNLRFTTAEEIADLVTYLSRKEARPITGTSHSIDGGWTAW